MLSLPLLYPWMQVSRVMIPYFCGALRSLKAAFMLPGSKAYARMTAGGCVAGWDKLSRTVVPPLSSPLGLTRGSRAIIPYFSEVSMSIKAAFMLPGSKAFARMTAGEALPVVGSFVGGDVPPVVMPFPVGHPGQRVLIFVGR